MQQLQCVVCTAQETALKPYNATVIARENRIEDKIGFRRLLPCSSIISLLIQIGLFLYLVVTVPFLGPEE